MGNPVIILNGDEQYFVVTYYDNNDAVRRSFLESQWKTFNRHDPAMNQSYQIWCRPTNPNMEVVVDHLFPQKSIAGKYRIETFIPAIHAESRQVIFNVTHAVNLDSGQPQEETTMAVVDMAGKNDVWQSLGEFELNPAIHPLIGKVRQYDLSLEEPPVETAYGPVRWVPLFVDPGKRNRFDAPVGTKDDRDGVFPSGKAAYSKYPVWVGAWFDANPFLNWYTYGYHTGADLNLPGSSGADKGKEIYSVGDGKVTFAGRAGTWGNIIVIEHENALVTLPDGRRRRQVVYSRYGHVDDRILVNKGQSVKRGQNIGFIGLPANAVAGWHLHFDVCYTDMLLRRPAHWPNMDTIRALRWSNRDRDSRGYNGAKSSVMREVLDNYVDPLRFIEENHN
jgi:murein DD-endopeptidase MepM/ murein hydrolase activator NlpD